MKEVLTQTETLLSIFLSAPVLALPFSKEIRKIIGKRDGWRDADTGESFFDGIMVHASHFFHDKTSPNYNSPENGRIQTVTNHLKYHLDHVGQATKIGLSEAANSRAIELLKKTPTHTRKWLERNK